MSGIPESQLETWSHLGSVQQSQQTHETIRKVLNDSKAPYSGRSCKDFLQGSYANSTNIYGDSDVDVVMMLEDVFGHDLSELDEPAKTKFHTEFENAAYTYFDFKKDVAAWLGKNYGTAVTPSNKAIFIKGEGNRRDADVLPCIRFRRYHRFDGILNQSYAEGICFWSGDGTRIINYPEQHRDNCVTKHKVTGSMFKPCVRILKNIRNQMIEKGLIADDLAPSYYLEGLLYNVPADKFGVTYHDTMADCLNWVLGQKDRSKFVCANEQYYLLRESSPVTWRAEKCEKFLEAAKNYWNNY